MNRQAVWGINAGLFALCCFLIAGMIAEVGAARLAPEPAAVPAAPRQAPPRARPARERIVDRNLFGSSEVAEVVPEQALEDEELEATALPLKLLGTAASPDAALAWAAIDDLQLRKHRIVATGGEVGGATVVRIERKRVVLRNGAKLEELSLEDRQTPGQVTAQRPTRPERPSPVARRENLAARVRAVAENRFEVNSQDVQEAARNPAALFSEARILPRYEEGQMVGIQLNAIKEGSLFQEVGLQDGDTIIEFNGQSLGTPADSAQFLQQLIDGQSFQVLVRGEDGTQRALSFEASQ
jgi:general secretion pathway protein C